MSSNSPSPDEIMRATNKCRHYNGVQSKVCLAGINYRAAFGSSTDFNMYPCFRYHKTGFLCVSRDFPTPDEAIDEQQKHVDELREFFDNLKQNVCPHCKTQIQVRTTRQRTVYAFPCGCKLYDSKVTSL